jgi:MraZ protein
MPLVEGKEESMCNSLKVDHKGRLKIPMPLLNTLKGFGTEFYVTSENGQSVRIYSMRVWNKVEGQLGRLHFPNVDNQKVLTHVKYFGQTVTMDKQGRVLIPILLRRNARIKGVVDVLEFVNYLEVWNHARLMNNLENNPITTQEKDTLNDLSSAPGFSWAKDLDNGERNVRGKGRRFGVHPRAKGIRNHSTQTIRDARADSLGRARVA